MMRIIAGKANRRKLETLPGEDITRPTGERVKEGLFSAIQFELADRTVLDLFAGTAQLSLEALSRGAKSAVIIDSSTDAVEIIKKNAKTTELIKQCKISRMDYSEFLKSASTRGEKFDLIFLDPPYAKDMKNEILKKVSRADICADGAIIVCETAVDFMGDETKVHTFDLRKVYRYGHTYITLLTYGQNDTTTEE